MACDLVIAAEHVEFGLPEPRRGIYAGGGGVHRLPRQVPLKLAMEYLLTGKSMTATRAVEIGIINQVVPFGAGRSRGRPNRPNHARRAAFPSSYKASGDEGTGSTVR